MVLMLLTALASGCAPHLGDSEAALALEDIATGILPSRLKAQTPRPARRTVAYEIDGRSRKGDFYISPEGASAGIVLVPGVVPAGTNDRRLVSLAKTLARLRFAVLIPDIEGLRKYRVRKSDVKEVADAFRHLKSRPELQFQDSVGIAGFSYGAGPVLLAALEPSIQDAVEFVVVLGGYYDLRTTVTYITTGYHRDTSVSEWQRRDPHPYALQVFTLSNSDLLDRPRDRAALGRYAREMHDGDIINSATTPTNLAPDAQAFLALLTNKDPNRIPMLIRGLSPRIRSELAGIDPASHDLSRYRADVIIVHGRGDNIIPFTESVALARAIPNNKAHLYLIDGFAHVDMGLERNDIPRMLRVMEQLLEYR
jgi:pimeloyl-ACP methyl ester carboxylesterase